MAFSGSQVTRLGLYGGARAPYGSFAGKTQIVPIFGGKWVAGMVSHGGFKEGDVKHPIFVRDVKHGGFQEGMVR